MNTFDPTPSHVSRFVIAASAIAFALFLSACGGGGSSTGTVTPPPVIPPQSPPGTLDASFGTGGTVITPLGGTTAQANAVVQQPDGKIIAAGYADVGILPARYAIALIRYNADGTLDKGFGAGGKVNSTSFLTNNAQANGVTLQPDGKIVVAGWSTQGFPDVCTILRLNADGSPDPTFGSGGVATRAVTNAINDHTQCSAPIVLANGKIVAAVGTGGDIGYVGLIRLNADGTSDSTFGVGGVAAFQTATHSGQASSVIVQPDGKIVVGGGNATLVNDNPPTIGGGYLLARFDATGVLDPAFGQGGVVKGSIPNATGATIGGMALQTDSRIVVATSVNVMRFLPNGTPDSGFGVGGSVPSVSGSGLAGPGIALQSNGKIVIAGSAGGGGGLGSGFALWRFGQDGALDASFGNGGSVVTPLGNGGFATDIAIQPNGEIVAAGMAQTPTTPPAAPANVTNFAVARYFGDPVTTTSP